MNGYTLKIIGYLMNYPTAELSEVAADIPGMLRRENWLSERMIGEIESFLAEAVAKDILDQEEGYVALFDRTPSLSLHLFEHVHGESRDRGQALVELDGLYREHGLENTSEHTPDYLPLFLEYLALLPVEEAQDNLDGAIDVIAVISERLKKRNSSYAVLFEALKETASRTPDEKKLQSAIKADSGRPLTQEEMDAAWEEQFAFADMNDTDGAASGCPAAEEMLARMGIPADEPLKTPADGDKDKE